MVVGVLVCWFYGFCWSFLLVVLLWPSNGVSLLEIHGQSGERFPRGLAALRKREAQAKRCSRSTFPWAG